MAPAPVRDSLRISIGRHRNGTAKPFYREPPSLQHGRIESRAIWTSTALNADLDFPHLGQVFAIEWRTIDNKSGKTSSEIICGITDHNPQSAGPAPVLADNRDHWRIEAHHYILDPSPQPRKRSPTASDASSAISR